MKPSCQNLTKRKVLLLLLSHFSRVRLCVTHRWQPTRLPHPWDSPGKNTGVGCHFLLQCMKVKSQSEVTQSCPTLRDPMDCSPPGSSVHGIFSRQEYWSGVPLPSPTHSRGSCKIGSHSSQTLLLLYQLSLCNTPNTWLSFQPSS